MTTTPKGQMVKRTDEQYGSGEGELKVKRTRSLERESLRRTSPSINNININTHNALACVCGALSPSGDLVRSTVCLRVAGHPVTQGSKRAFVAGGHARLVESGGDRHKLWRHAVNDEARRGWVEAPLAGPVVLDLIFDIQPPKSLTRARRAAGPVGQRSGDLDKLARAVLDALTGVVYLDDSQVVELVVTKRWAGPGGPGVTIGIKADELDVVGVLGDDRSS